MRGEPRAIKGRMDLYYSPTSPYVRKVLIAAYELGVRERLRFVRVNPHERNARLDKVNPLGKIPALVSRSGQVLYDSTVICEFLDAEFGGCRLIPATGSNRWSVTTLAALADGIIDAGVVVRQEGLRPQSKQYRPWIDLQLQKIQQGLDRIEAAAAAFGTDFNMGHIATICAIGWLDLRLGAHRWLESRPELKAWYAGTLARPSVRETAPPCD